MIKKINFINNRERKLLVATFLLTVFLISSVSAFGVGSPYWKGNPLIISPGDTKTFSMTLQNIETNKEDEKDITIRVTLKEGLGIASVKEKDYLVKAGTTNTKIPVTIIIPPDTPLGTPYSVTVSFKAISSGGGGAVGLTTGIDTTFDVLVKSVPKEEKPGINYLLIAISLILIIAILILIYIFRKKIFNKK